MSRKDRNTGHQIEFDGGGSLTRRRTEVLPDGVYLFEDELEVSGVLTTTVITCAAWLLELYELRAGELVFISGREEIRSPGRRFGVFFPPFSITRPCFKNVKGRVVGIASLESLPPEFIAKPITFRIDFDGPPAGVSQVIEILKAREIPQRIDTNPNASLLSLKAKRVIDENYLAYPSIARIAKRLGVTHEHLSRQFKRDFDMTPSAYFRQLRVADASIRLARGEEIVNVSQNVGYNDLSRFYKQFRKTTNTSPGACKTILRS